MTGHPRHRAAAGFNPTTETPTTSLPQWQDERDRDTASPARPHCGRTARPSAAAATSATPVARVAIVLAAGSCRGRSCRTSALLPATIGHSGGPGRTRPRPPQAGQPSRTDPGRNHRRGDGPTAAGRARERGQTAPVREPAINGVHGVGAAGVGRTPALTSVSRPLIAATAAEFPRCAAPCRASGTAAGPVTSCATPSAIS